MKKAGVRIVEEPKEEVGRIAPVGWPFGRWEDTASRGLIVVVALALTWYTWARWGDIQVDCGRELYVPSELLRGKLIYRDIFYQYGPLAPYLGALLIALFGAHLVVFYVFGIAVAIGCAMLLFELGTILDGRITGLTAALALLLIGFVPRFSNYGWHVSREYTNRRNKGKDAKRGFSQMMTVGALDQFVNCVHEKSAADEEHSERKNQKCNYYLKRHSDWQIQRIKPTRCQYCDHDR